MVLPLRLLAPNPLILRHVFCWIFVIAETFTLIMAANFLRQHRLLVNMKNGRLIDMTTELQAKGTTRHVVSLSLSFSPQNTAIEYDALLAKFPAATKPCISPQPVRHTVTHHIRITGPPLHAGDHRMLNRVTIPDRYPVSHIQDFTATLHSTTIFSKLNLVCAYHQIPVELSDVAKTCHYHTIRAIPIHTNAVRFEKCSPNLSMFYGLSVTRTGFLLCVHR